MNHSKDFMQTKFLTALTIHYAINDMELRKRDSKDAKKTEALNEQIEHAETELAELKVFLYNNRSFATSDIASRIYYIYADPGSAKSWDIPEELYSEFNKIEYHGTRKKRKK